MELKAYVKINKKWCDAIDQLKAAIYSAERQQLEELNALEARCLEEHGSHEDDGGFMHGHCTRCGAYLG